ncbi:MAG: hypothetical protein AAGA27_04710 [Pseudomonadota bacterium]
MLLFSQHQLTILAVIGNIFNVCLLLLIPILFALSVYKTSKQIPDKYKYFPDWFAWMMIIPLLNYIFAWIMLPFGVPGAIKRCFPDNNYIKPFHTSLRRWGLILVLIPIVTIIIMIITMLVTVLLVGHNPATPSIHLWLAIAFGTIGGLLFLLSLFSFIMYWAKVATVRPILVMANAMQDKQQ